MGSITHPLGLAHLHEGSLATFSIFTTIFPDKMAVLDQVVTVRTWASETLRGRDAKWDQMVLEDSMAASKKI